MRTKGIGLAAIALQLASFAAALPAYADVVTAEFTTATGGVSLATAPSATFTLQANGTVIVELQDSPGPNIGIAAFAFEGPQSFTLTDIAPNSSSADFLDSFGHFNNNIVSTSSFQSTNFIVGLPGEFTSAVQLFSSNNFGPGYEVSAVANGEQYAGIVSPVPLPPSAWLMLYGLGGLGFAARRRSA